MLELNDVSITYRAAPRPAVADVSLSIAAGERVGIVGESGSGKSTLTSAILRSLPTGSRVDGGIAFRGTELGGLSTARFRELRSAEIARIPQDPLASLNPVIRVGDQLRDVLQAHRRISRAECIPLIEEALAEVGIPEPAVKRKAFPHELSGGMRQRVLIAMSLINEPRLLIADEPTTALDVTVQAQILDLLQRELDSREMTLLLITHDIGVVTEVCTRIVVMRHGRIVEDGPTEQLMANPGHPYTRQLFAAARMQVSAPRASDRKPQS
ncbi:ABC transporter ATP-binding protein [Microbacterium capsulatum]|uniref:ABC transporter ATP-binding protein n=1 Tax=Microbacterium capsulatum TaxID=3041921 RepID=A0ABU0XHE4_9MICO|nr:ABC transporter ATP-binding protein [Microbacterium sp. ASV81]MDQ4214540.1 ABC transporter ATP-binding protein [Microbacterium sp. ASV81]